jgi:hypothetical protein
MPQDHRLQRQRFELKYLIQEGITGRIRDFLSSYLDLDEYGVGKPNFAYPVHSLYLDSDLLTTFHSSINGTKNRFKLRLRYYDNRADSPIFFEIKGRVDNTILKERCGVRRSAVPLVISGQMPEPDQFVTREPRHFASLEKFIGLMQHLKARPKAHNNYTREAWVSRHDNSIRVTFDRGIQIEPSFRSKAVTTLANPARVFPEFVILELKFTSRFPNWFADLVRRFNLMQASSSKYAEGILMLGEHRFHDGDRAFDWVGLRSRDMAVGAMETAAPGAEGFA